MKIYCHVCQVMVKGAFDHLESFSKPKVPECCLPRGPNKHQL